MSNTGFLRSLIDDVGVEISEPAWVADVQIPSRRATTSLVVLTVGLLGDIGQPPDPDIYYAKNDTAIRIGLPVYTDESALELAFDKGTVDTVVAALPSSSLDKYGRPRVGLLPADAAGCALGVAASPPTRSSSEEDGWSTSPWPSRRSPCRTLCTRRSASGSSSALRAGQSPAGAAHRGGARRLPRAAA